MQFSQVIIILLAIVDLINQYDEVAIKIIKAISALLPEKYKKVLDFIVKYEPPFMIALLDIVGKTEKQGGNGQAKLKAAASAIKLTGVSLKKNIKLKDVIGEVVGMINLFVKG